MEEFNKNLQRVLGTLNDTIEVMGEINEKLDKVDSNWKEIEKVIKGESK